MDYFLTISGKYAPVGLFLLNNCVTAVTTLTVPHLQVLSTEVNHHHQSFPKDSSFDTASPPMICTDPASPLPSFKRALQADLSFFHVINSCFSFDSLEIHPKSVMPHRHYLQTSEHLCLLQDLCSLSATWLLHSKHLLQTITQCHWIKSKISLADSEVRLPGTAEGTIFSIYLSLGLANILVSQSKITSILLFV